ncbi:hypothetical protein [uncultured Pelagimonas sp.]|uniref:hypothetical protein n=1 Tax=uncultured Pelagimonas sp. TaxID=1618102 RepID=UPI002635DFC9|nr:hypothetical protein [uncultured Pelagimonas sp.]
MYATEYPYAGLILPDAQDLDPRPYLNAARRVLAKLDPHPNGGSRLNDTADTVRGGFFGLRVTPQEDSDYGPRMVLEVVTSEGTPTEDEAAAQILSDTVLSALKDSPADIIEWYSPDVLLDAEDFVRLRSYVSPKRGRVNPTQPTPPAETRTLPEPAPLSEPITETLVLGDHFEEQPLERDILTELYDTTEDELAAPAATPEPEVSDQAQTSRLSAASWLIAAIVAIISFPVGVAMFIIGLYRGMDFRLVSQVMVVTILFAVLYNTDRLNLVLRQVLQ